VRIRATFKRYPTAQTYTVPKTVDVTINPPNRIEIDPIHLDIAFPLATANQPNIAVGLKLRRGSRDVYTQGIMLEKLDRTIYGKDPDMPWGTAPYLSCTGPGEVTDWKGVYIAPDQIAAWNAQAVDWVIDEFDQSYRIRLETGCGGTADYDLQPTYHFKMMKVDNGHWKLHRVN